MGISDLCQSKEHYPNASTDEETSSAHAHQADYRELTTNYVERQLPLPSALLLIQHVKSATNEVGKSMPVLAELRILLKIGPKTQFDESSTIRSPTVSSMCANFKRY